MGGGRVAAPAPAVVHHQPQTMRVPVNMNDDPYDDPNDPFPALTKSHAGVRPGTHDQTVTVNIRGLGGRGPVQRTALDGEDAFVLAEIGMPSANANRPGGRRVRGPGEPNYVPQNSITPSLAMAPHFTPTSSMPNMPNNMQMPNTSLQQQQQQQKQFQQQQMTPDMMQQQYNADMYAQQYGMSNQFAPAATQAQYYMMMPGADGQAQAATQAQYYMMMPGADGQAGAMGQGGMGTNNQYNQYQQSLQSQQMQMGGRMGGQMPPLPTGAMPFQPAVAPNNQGPAGKPVSRRYSQMSFGIQNQNTAQMEMGH